MARNVDVVVAQGPSRTWPEAPRFVYVLNEPAGIANIPDQSFTSIPPKVTFPNVPTANGYTVTVRSLGATGNVLAPDVTSSPFNVPADIVLPGVATITISIAAAA